MGTWRTVHPQRILHAPGAISVYGSFSLGEPRTRALQSGAEDSTDWATSIEKMTKYIWYKSILHCSEGLTSLVFY